MIVLAVCICLTVFTTKEPPFMSEGPSMLLCFTLVSLTYLIRIIIVENPFKKIYTGLVKMPVVVFRVCIVQFFVWYRLSFT
jgi:hypothetical protein